MTNSGSAVTFDEEAFLRLLTPVEGIDALLVYIDKMRALAPDPSSQAKYRNTRVFLDEVKRRWQAANKRFKAATLSPVDATVRPDQDGFGSE